MNPANEGDPVAVRPRLQSPHQLRCSIILATLNERTNLPILLDQIRDLALPSTEVLVVDDGSTDGTREFVAERSERDRSIRLLLHEGKQTTLRAQCQGIDDARGEYIVIMDADLQHPPMVIPRLLQALDQGAALSIASRYAAGGSPGPRTVLRWTYSHGAEWLTKLLLPPSRGVSDPVSGYFAFRRDVWVRLNPLYRGYKLLLFLLVMAEGRPVREVGFKFTPRTEGASKVTDTTGFLRVFLTELILARRFRTRWRRASNADGADHGASRAPLSLLR